MQIADVDNYYVKPALALCSDVSGKNMSTQLARIQLLAIGMQESRLQYRRQVNGPAHGYLQFEKSGLRGVLTHRSSLMTAKHVCERLDYTAVVDDVYDAIPDNGILAFAMGRLLLWTDPRALPADADGGWNLYLRLWRPGRPRPETWALCYSKAAAQVTG